MAQNLDYLQKKYFKQMLILYTLCQFPQGALDKDLEYIYSE